MNKVSFLSVCHEVEREDWWHCNLQDVSLKHVLWECPVIQTFEEEVITHINLELEYSMIFEDAYAFLNNLHAS